MNKKEAKQRIHNLEEELAELKYLLDQPEGRWRAEEGEYFWYVSNTGVVLKTLEGNTGADKKLYKAGNYFQTEEQAKASNIYKILNSEYEYYFAGVSDNWDDVPKDKRLIEWFDSEDGNWCEYYGNRVPVFNYRWKRI